MDGDVGVSWSPLPGGWSGESHLSVVGGSQTVVRIYDPARARRPDCAEVDAALMRLLRGVVPVPEVVESRPPRGDVPALVVTTYVRGRRADDVVREATGQGDVVTLEAVGRRLGRCAARISMVPTLRRGHFTAPDLAVRASDDVVDLYDTWERERSTLTELPGWGSDLADRLAAVAQGAQEDLDRVGRTVLVHGDFITKNVVLDGDLDVAALVDFEHAHSGDVHADLGSLIRFDRHSAWEASVLSGWCEVTGEEADTARDLARAADLRSLIELAVRPGGNLVVDLARVFLEEIALTGDLHAHP